VVYEVGGRAVSLDLGAAGQRAVAFTRSELETLKIISAPREATARAYYIGEPGEAGMTPSEDVKISKKLTAAGENRYDAELLIEFSDAAPTGVYDISDWMPSNTRLWQFDPQSVNGSWYSHYSSEGQKLYITLDRNSKINRIVLRYTVQKTFDSEAVADSAYIIHGDSGVSNFTPRTPFTTD
jgi:hypothetical protein